MARQKKPQPTHVPPRAPNGIKVYYDAEDEHHIRQEAKRNGFSSVQEYLKWLQRRRRQGLPT
jgi:hypothetical protein